ncbi:hypothetical protein PMIN07_012637 [Paraphaeosphaeria minitans]
MCLSRQGRGTLPMLLEDGRTGVVIQGRLHRSRCQEKVSVASSTATMMNVKSENLDEAVILGMVSTTLIHFDVTVAFQHLLIEYGKVLKFRQRPSISSRSPYS